jgi:cell division protein FtsQ
MILTDRRGRAPDRTRAGRWRLLRPMLLVAVGAVLLAGVGWGTLLSSAVALRRVSVEGAPAAVVAPARAAAADQLGRPFLAVDTEVVRRRVAAIPAVARASVSRRWPRGIAVTVVPRTPAAAARTWDGRYRLLDASGVAYDTVADRPGQVPVLLVDPDTARPEVLRAVVLVAGALPAGLRARVETIRADSPEAVLLRLADGQTVRWGSAERSSRKAEVLAALLRQPGKARGYDVSAPDVPTIR